tara:strand:+ start:752 stop:1336 length:585 start_codon:yes stop_codon:yes gene_type:complete
MKNKINIILLILLSSCTEEITIVDTNINHNPQIEFISIDPIFVLSELDTSYLEINLFASDLNGLDDIEQVSYYVKRENFYKGTPNAENQTCEYSIENDAGYITTDSPYLFSANCYGDFDQNLGKICEELTIEECQGSNECIIEDDNILFYTFQLFRPFGYPHCGGFGNVKFQFIVTDKIGLEDVSEEIIVEIVP